MTAENSPITIVDLSESPLCQVKMRLDIAAQFSKQVRQVALARVAREVALPGFRPGKVPPSYLQKHHHNQIDSRWSQELAEAAIEQALKQNKTRPFAENQRVEFTWDHLDLDGVSSLVARFESQPSPPEKIDVKALEVTPPDPSTSSSETIDNVLTAEAEKRASFRQVSGPSREGLWADFEIKTLQDPPQNLLLRKKSILNQKLPQWALALLLNLEVGKERAGKAPLGKEKSDIECQALIEKLYERDVPPIDDALAKQLGFDNLEGWQNSVQERLNKRAKDELRAKGHRVLLDAILKAHPFEVPKSALEREIKSLKEQKTNDKRSEDEIREEALKSLRRFFLLNQWTIKREDLVSKEEIDQLVFAQLRHLDPKASKEVLQRQLAYLYHGARLSTIASRVLDELMQELNW